VLPDAPEAPIKAAPIQPGSVAAKLEAAAANLPPIPHEEGKKANPPNPPPSWQGFVMKGTAAVLWIVIVASLVFIAWNTFVIASIAGAFKTHSPMYSWAGMNILSGTMLRTLAIFFGAAVMFAGAATAFYTLGHTTNISGQQGAGADALKFAVATASPGVIAVLAGGFVITVAVLSKIESQLNSPSDGHLFTAGTPVALPARIPSAAEVLKQAEEEAKAAKADAKSDGKPEAPRNDPAKPQ
jgi:hypothetical protein